MIRFIENNGKQVESRYVLSDTDLVQRGKAEGVVDLLKKNTRKDVSRDVLLTSRV